MVAATADADDEMPEAAATAEEVAPEAAAAALGAAAKPGRGMGPAET